MKPSSAREGKALSTGRSSHLLSNPKIWQGLTAQEPLVFANGSGQQEKNVRTSVGISLLVE